MVSWKKVKYHLRLIEAADVSSFYLYIFFENLGIKIISMCSVFLYRKVMCVQENVLLSSHLVGWLLNPNHRSLDVPESP
jgi:hypothetical protein